MYKFVSTLPRGLKQFIMLAVDILLVPLAFLVVVALQSSSGGVDLDLADAWGRYWPMITLLMVTCALLAHVMNIPRIQLKSYESHAVGLTALHALALGVTGAVIDNLLGGGTTVATFINFAVIFFLVAVAARLILLQLLNQIYRLGTKRVRVLIYGAGGTGRKLAAALNSDISIEAVAFVDDDKSKQLTMSQGLRIYSPLTLDTLVRQRNITRILLAMPHLSPSRSAQILRGLDSLDVDVHALPSFSQMTGQTSLQDQLRRVAPDAFLGRAPLDSELPGRSDQYAGRSVFISGAGGSIGSELCRQILACRPSCLVLFEMNELGLYTINLELQQRADELGIPLIPVLGTVTDGEAVRRTMTQYNVEIVLHAAAYKHVPLVEQNASVGAFNNVIGTEALAQAAIACNVDRFILISTDKAVRPTNMMGASKRVAEMVLQDLANRAPEGGTIFSIVRFGNVMGSSGSVIPLFQKQIAKGGPVTLTHRHVTRYFMTIAEAARLVLVAGSFAEGGDVFVLDMGEPISIYDLACQMIVAAGCSVRDDANPDGDISIVETGLRPGEKIHEELLIGETQTTTAHPKIMRAREAFPSQIEVAAVLKSVRRTAVDGDDAKLRRAVARLVEGNATLVHQPEKTNHMPRG